MPNLAVPVLVHDLLADEFVFIEAVAAFVLNHLVLDAGEEGGEAVVVVLSPTVERMVVALGALHPDAEKNLGDRLGPAVRVAQGTVEVGGRVGVAAAAAGEQFPRELVERLALGDALANPVMEHLDAFAIQQLLLVAEQVGPPERPEVGELWPLQESIYQTGSFVLPGIARERAGFHHRGEHAEKVQVRPALEYRIAA